MTEKTNQPNPLLLQITATLSETKAILKGQGERFEKSLDKIQEDNRDARERLVALEKDSAVMQDDIAKRTHLEETNRIKARMDKAESRIDSKASNAMMKVVIGLLVSIFMLMMGGIAKIAFFPA